MAGEPKRKTAPGYLPVLPPRFALVELAIFAAVVGGEYYFDAFPDLTRLNPHPYWIAVLLLSLQYGTVSGLLAAALAIVGTWLIGLPEAEIGESYFSYLIRVWTQPVLWIVVALLLGSFRMRQIEEREGLQRQVDDATAQSAALAGYSEQLKARVDGLERKIAVSDKPQTRQLLDAFGMVRRGASTEARTEAARKALALALPGASLSVFAVDGGDLKQVLAVNWPPDAPWRLDFAAEHGLCRAIIGDQRSLSILRAGDDSILGAEGKLAVPIHAAEGSSVVGMLKAEEMPARDIDSGVLARAAVIAQALLPLVAPPPGSGAGRVGEVVPLVQRKRLALQSKTEVDATVVSGPSSRETQS